MRSICLISCILSATMFLELFLKCLFAMTWSWKIATLKTGKKSWGLACLQSCVVCNRVITEKYYCCILNLENVAVFCCGSWLLLDMLAAAGKLIHVWRVLELYCRTRVKVSLQLVLNTFWVISVPEGANWLRICQCPGCQGNRLLGAMS